MRDLGMRTVQGLSLQVYGADSLEDYQRGSKMESFDANSCCVVLFSNRSYQLSLSSLGNQYLLQQVAKGGFSTQDDDRTPLNSLYAELSETFALMSKSPRESVRVSLESIIGEKGLGPILSLAEEENELVISPLTQVYAFYCGPLQLIGEPSLLVYGFSRPNNRRRNKSPGPKELLSS